MEWLKKTLQSIDPLLTLVLTGVLIIGSSGAMIYMFVTDAFAWEFFLTFALTLYLGVRDFVNRVLKSDS